MEQKAIFFDRDGVINFRVVGEYVTNYEDFKFCPDMPEFLAFVKSKGYLAIVITNQQGIGKGLMSHEDLDSIHSKMQSDLIEKVGVNFDDIYYCAALNSEYCERRKPNPGMILEAVEKWNIDKSRSWMIGDSISDILAANNAEVGSVFLGHHLPNPFVNADFQFMNFWELQSNFPNIENFVRPQEI
jgi:D-glycero-D-manno-heptose 1,7-bisphosphate phosphatase